MFLPILMAVFGAALILLIIFGEVDYDHDARER